MDLQQAFYFHIDDEFMEMANYIFEKHKLSIELEFKMEPTIKTYHIDLNNEEYQDVVSTYGKTSYNRKYFPTRVINRTYKSGNIIVIYEYQLKGHHHRQNGPAVITYKNGNLYEKIYYENGTKHHDLHPAYIKYYPSGAVKELIYYRKGKKHNLAEPAEYLFYENGEVYISCWYKENFKHREDGPSYIKYAPDGHVIECAWHNENVLHRKDGPALIIDGVESWFIHGIERHQ